LNLSPLSSESETDNNDETADKFLLLVDQVTLDQPSHLNIKDIGVILERLSTKIVDVERLEREIEGQTHNWTIKAAIRDDHSFCQTRIFVKIILNWTWSS
jgi:hypothetical protein